MAAEYLLVLRQTPGHTVGFEADTRATLLVLGGPKGTVLFYQYETSRNIQGSTSQEVATLVIPV